LFLSKAKNVAIERSPGHKKDQCWAKGGDDEGNYLKKGDANTTQKGKMKRYALQVIVDALII
jgi:hypothetical protein